MEKRTFTIKGQVMILPPFTTGQLRRHVDPLLEKNLEIQKQARQIREDDIEAMQGLTVEARKLQRLQADVVLMGLQNTYPKTTMEDLDDLTPTQITTLFNLLQAVTQEGSNEPGEAAAPARKAKRSR